MENESTTPEVPEEVVIPQPEIIISEDSIIETNLEVPEEVVVVEAPPIYIPDTPAQCVDIKNNSEEINFLERILDIQHTGGFGRHLDVLINERIKSLKGI